MQQITEAAFREGPGADLRYTKTCKGAMVKFDFTGRLPAGTPAGTIAKTGY